MELAEKLLTWLDGLTNPKLLENLSNFLPSATEITYICRSNGTHTLFDDATRMAWCRDNGHLSAEDIGRMSVSQASSEFARKLIKQECNISAVVPLSSVEAVSNSKSDLIKFPSLHAFGKYYYDLYREEFRDFSEQKYFEYCIDGGLKQGKTDFDIKLWAPSLRWVN